MSFIFGAVLMALGLFMVVAGMLLLRFVKEPLTRDLQTTTIKVCPDCAIDVSYPMSLTVCPIHNKNLVSEDIPIDVNVSQNNPTATRFVPLKVANVETADVALYETENTTLAIENDDQKNEYLDDSSKNDIESATDTIEPLDDLEMSDLFEDDEASEPLDEQNLANEDDDFA